MTIVKCHDKDKNNFEICCFENIIKPKACFYKCSLLGWSSQFFLDVFQQYMNAEINVCIQYFYVKIYHFVQNGIMPSAHLITNPTQE